MDSWAERKIADEEGIYFETRDFKGRRIICTKLQWHEHIAESTHHSYMDGAEEDVIETLKSPHGGLRYCDRVYKNRRVYYKYNKTWRDYLKVVIEFKDGTCDGIGFILTAYQQDQPTNGERPDL